VASNVDKGINLVYADGTIIWTLTFRRKVGPKKSKKVYLHFTRYTATSGQ